MKSRAVRPVVALASVLLACGSDVSTPRTSMRDSAGVEIIESAAPQWGPGQAWIVATEPALDLAESGQGADYEFYRVADAKRLSDGRIVVAMPTEIRYYSSSGTYLLTVGGEGDGPGEFRRLSGLGTLPPDSLVAFDRTRITVFGPSGNFARTARVEAVSPSYDAFAVLGNGFVILEYRGPFAEENVESGLEMGVYREPTPVVLLSATGGVQDTLLIGAGYESALIRVGSQVADGPAVLGRSTHVAAVGRQLIVGDAIEFGYTVLNADGVTKRIVRGAKDLTLRPEVVQAELLTRYGADSSPRALEFIRDYPGPARMPAYRELKVDATGAVWLAEHRGRAVFETSWDPNTWDVFSPEGEWLGQVRTPGRFRVFEIGANYVLGVGKDRMDVEHVQILPLRR